MLPCFLTSLGATCDTLFAVWDAKLGQGPIPSIIEAESDSVIVPALVRGTAAAAGSLVAVDEG
eukprot:SAG11_NODE_6325_length_1336_cov_1.188359_1_plen_62_part_10